MLPDSEVTAVFIIISWRISGYQYQNQNMVRVVKNTLHNAVIDDSILSDSNRVVNSPDMVITAIPKGRWIVM